MLQRRRMICSNCCNHTQFRSSFLEWDLPNTTCHRVCAYMSDTADTTYGARSDFPFGESEITAGFFCMV